MLSSEGIYIIKLALKRYDVLGELVNNVNVEFVFEENSIPLNDVLISILNEKLKVEYFGSEN